MTQHGAPNVDRANDRHSQQTGTCAWAVMICCRQFKELTMPLFHVQDNDRPAYVIADNYAQAIERWTAAVQQENDGECDPPAGVRIVCDDTDLIDKDGFVR